MEGYYCVVHSRVEDGRWRMEDGVGRGGKGGSERKEGGAKTVTYRGDGWPIGGRE